jgi:hypothetical protein
VLAALAGLVLASCSQLPAPSVATFDALPTTLTRGASATLSWTLAGGAPSSVTIDPGVGGVTGLTQKSVQPTDTTTYTLTARNGGGSATSTVTVTVVPDTQAPSVTVTSPADGATAATSGLTVEGTANDDVGVASVAASLNGGSAQGCTGAATFTCSVGPLQTGSNTITVTAQDAAGNDGTRTLTVFYGTVTDPYNITLDFASSISSTQRAAFMDAAARWAQVITTGLPDVAATIPAGACSGLPTSDYNATIDDVRISVQVGPIDGPGNVLGFGGPCYTRSSDGLTAYGIMEFDSADLSMLEQQGLLQATILHEMGHVLGFGTLWGSLLTGAGSDNPRFTGTNAVREWQALGGTGQVPVENCLDATGTAIQGCGSGTRDAHWREATFGSELMTGYINGGANPMSRVTVGSLADLGYVVDYAAADSYSLPPAVTLQSLAAATHLDFRLVGPIGSLP